MATAGGSDARRRAMDPGLAMDDLHTSYKLSQPGASTFLVPTNIIPHFMGAYLSVIFTHFFICCRASTRLYSAHASSHGLVFSTASTASAVELYSSTAFIQYPPLRSVWPDACGVIQCLPFRIVGRSLPVASPASRSSPCGSGLLSCPLRPL